MNYEPSLQGTQGVLKYNVGINMGAESKHKITQERLKELLHYDPDTGNFYNVVTRGPRAQEGTIAGSLQNMGYIAIGYGGSKYLAHRLAFLSMTGEWPEYDVDHINGVRTDNRWANLRSATRTENQQNLRGAKSNSKTRLLGVSPYKGGFRATITSNGKQITLGRFSCPHDAHSAYLKAKAELHQFSTL